MRDPRELDESDLLRLPVGEFDWLEIKGRKTLEADGAAVGGDRLRNVLSPAISALANTGGGILVIGLQNPADPSQPPTWTTVAWDLP